MREFLRPPTVEVHARQSRWPADLINRKEKLYCARPRIEIDLFKREIKERLTGRPHAEWFRLLGKSRYAALAGGVVGIGFGAKISDGRVTERDCVRIYVRRKIASRELTRSHRVPKTVNGLPTDVIVLSQNIPEAVPCGVSVGHRKFSGGTIGCIVRRNGRNFLLSNNHVLAECNGAKLDDEIWHPGSGDGGGSPPIAKLSDFKLLDFDGCPNRMDAAIAELFDPASVRPQVRIIGTLGAAIPEPVAGTLVEKCGRGSNYTNGYIEGISEDVPVYFLGHGTAHFTGQISVRGVDRPFTEQGDSGSVVVAAETNEPVGLHFASGYSKKDPSLRLSFATPLGRILSEFGVALVT